jgi:hypothetical protein
VKPYIGTAIWCHNGRIIGVAACVADNEEASKQKFAEIYAKFFAQILGQPLDAETFITMMEGKVTIQITDLSIVEGYEIKVGEKIVSNNLRTDTAFQIFH